MNNPLQSLVYRATDSKNPTDDWDSIMQISDLLCQNPDEYTKLLLPLLNARLRDANSITVIYSLTLADALMKNTSDFVKQQFLRSDFMSIINNLASRSPDLSVRQKATEVMNENQIPQASQTIQQPPPVSQPPRTVPQSQPPVVSQPLSTNTKRTTKKLATYQEKLDTDLNVVKENVSLLNELISASSTSSELKQDDTAAQLRTNCEEMSRRIIGLIEMIPEEQVLLKLLEVHENLSNATQRYDKFMTTGQKEAVRLASPSGNNSSAPPLSPPVSQGFGALANRNNPSTVNRNAPTKPNNGGALSLDDFLGTNSTPIQPQPSIPQNNPNINSNTSKTPLSLDDFLGLPVQPSQPQPSIPQNNYYAQQPQQQQPMHYNPNQQFNNPPPSYDYSNNPYGDTMEREFSRLNPQQPQPQQQPNNTMYPNVGYNPYSSSSDQIDPNDPFGVSKQSQPQEGGFAALAHRKKN